MKEKFLYNFFFLGLKKVFNNKSTTVTFFRLYFHKPLLCSQGTYPDQTGDFPSLSSDSELNAGYKTKHVDGFSLCVVIKYCITEWQYILNIEGRWQGKSHFFFYSIQSLYYTFTISPWMSVRLCSGWESAWESAWELAGNHAAITSMSLCSARLSNF